MWDRRESWAPIWGAMSASTVTAKPGGVSALSVLIHAPFGRDSELIGRVLERAGLGVHQCPDLHDIYAGIAQSPGVVIVADEALNQSVVREFASHLQDQPHWSDLPVIVLTSGGEADEASTYRLRLLEPLGNLTLLERPLRKVTLISAIHTALRARTRQYEIRDYLQERQQSEEQLRQSEERWRFLANALPHFIWVKRKDGSLQFINQYWSDYTGLPQEENSDWLHAIHPEDLHLVNSLQSGEAKRGLETSFDFRVKRASDSTWRWHLGLQKPEYDSTGRLFRWIGAGIEIHDRLETEAALRRANAALEQFAYAAAHDLQEPVRTIAIYAQLIAAALKGNVDEQIAQYLRFTTEGAQRMQNLIHDLFDYTRALDDQSVSEKHCDTKTVMELVLRNLQSAIEESGAEITYGALPVLAVSEAHMMQLLQNLLSNALKYRSNAPPKIDVSARKKDDQWLFVVRDNGQGIAPEHHQKIFEVFKRLHGREVPGTGIGLAICERVVTHYGGRIWLESRPGQGTTFYFLLPPVMREQG